MATFQPRLVAFAPCQGVQVRPDGTVTLDGIFTRLTLIDPGPDAEFEFDVVALLIGGLGDDEAELRLIEPDGAVAFGQTRALRFRERSQLVAVHWRVRSARTAGDYELELRVGSDILGLVPLVVAGSTGGQGGDKL